MNNAFSLYLDLVRFSAACLVYIYHSNQRWLVTDNLPASTFGHSSVIIFFVLSGFIIAYITDTKENTLTEYSASRLARVYSVVLPAIPLTIILDGLGRQAMPAVYNYPFDQFFIRVPSSLLFLNEIWFVSITSFSNVPFWSICYEVWYYVAYAFFLFAPRPWNYLAIFLLAIVLGPKIVLLSPLWLLGVLLYKWRALQRISEPTSWLLFLAATVGIVVFHKVGAQDVGKNILEASIGEDLTKQLTFSKFFLSDYILGPLVFLNFLGARNIAHRFSCVLFFCAHPIRTLAAYTFTLYLLHQPLFLFWGSMLHGDPSNHLYWLQTTALVIVSIALIGFLTENKRYLLKRGIRLALLNCKNLITSLPNKGFR